MADGWPLPGLFRRHRRRGGTHWLAGARPCHRRFGPSALAPRIARLAMQPASPEKTEAPAPKPSRLARLQEVKLPLWVSVILLLVLLIVFTWGRLTSGAAERRLEAERQQLAQKAEAERSAMQRETHEILARETRELQLLFGHALAWAVRSAMLRNNFDQIDLYFADLVRNRRV